ncbi:hypothetical protein [Arthrobacter sp. JCM 19049]|uniref:hypothetical protein n=1 Tax=Arthrobacter sp. JCM 19049 TaxID=1460643 RepID=UPI0035B56379
MHSRGHRVHVLASRGNKGKTYTEVRPEAIVHRLESHAVPTHDYFRITYRGRSTSRSSGCCGRSGPMRFMPKATT